MINTKLIYPDLSYRIRGCCFHVYNTLGAGHKEIIYQRALAKTLKDQKIQFYREKKISVTYEGAVLGMYVPDFVVENKVLLEIKSLDFNLSKSKQQLIYYLRGSSFQLGFLVNFGTIPITIIRCIDIKKDKN